MKEEELEKPSRTSKRKLSTDESNWKQKFVDNLTFLSVSSLSLKDVIT